MTPPELKTLLDAALKADPTIILMPPYAHDAEVPGPPCCCPLAALMPRDKRRHGYPLTPDLPDGLERQHADEFIEGFDSAVTKTEFGKLGLSYRKHPRCALTRPGARPQ